MRMPGSAVPGVVISAGLTASSCKAVEGIFKAGVWVGVLIAVVIVVAVLALFKRTS